MTVLKYSLETRPTAFIPNEIFPTNVSLLKNNFITIFRWRNVENKIEEIEIETSQFPNLIHKP